MTDTPLSTDVPAYPPALAALAGHGGGSRPDFEMYPSFENPDETARWFRLWTGDPGADGGEFRFFGVEGAGGYVGLWLVREGAPLEAQPVVFLGSEGETAVLAGDVAGFLWLLAQGVGPVEAMGWDEPCEPDPDLVRIAERHAPGTRRDPQEILRLAREEFPGFDDMIQGMCR
ncbi:hypothetical protein SUDANB121_00119 [Nocardiopsis dassonvillei]|uniref:SMI1/KNR4 family protein n=1 Tax=Nocardiopsis dassonvillei TaxID=2014 RepID=UPI003F56FD69